MSKTMTITPTSEKLVAAFEAAVQAKAFRIEAREHLGETELEYLQADADLRRHISALERKVRRLKQEIKVLDGSVARTTDDRRDWVKAKAALTSPTIKIARPDGRMETVKNPFYSDPKTATPRPLSAREYRGLINSVIVPKP